MPSRRSPWSGLTAEDALTLADALTREQLRGPEGPWRVHLEHARRCAAALVGNDLRGALRAAEIATAAGRLWEQESARQVQGQSEPIVHDDEPTTPTPEARRAPVTHPPHALTVVPGPTHRSSRRTGPRHVPQDTPSAHVVRPR